MSSVFIILLASVIITRDDKNAICGGAIVGVLAGLLCTLPSALFGMGFDSVLLGSWMLIGTLIGGVVEVGCALVSRADHLS